jgi:hypothetical protein
VESGGDAVHEFGDAMVSMTAFGKWWRIKAWSSATT